MSDKVKWGILGTANIARYATIPVPNSLHKEWVIKALKAKKSVLCEKPIALCEADAKEMFDTAEENGVHLMEAYAYLHTWTACFLPSATKIV